MHRYHQLVRDWKDNTLNWGRRPVLVLGPWDELKVVRQTNGGLDEETPEPSGSGEIRRRALEIPIMNRLRERMDRRRSR